MSLLEEFLRELLSLPEEERKVILEFNSKLLGEPSGYRSELLKHYNTILSDQDLLEVVRHLDRVKDDPGELAYTRSDTLKRIQRYVNSAAKETRKGPDGTRIPRVGKFEIAKVNFAGLGSELDDKHYAIIWEAYPKRDHVVVIPTTSFKEISTLETGTSFNIGCVGAMQAETVVTLGQITTLSRKRIINVEGYRDGTRKVYHKLNPAQQARLLDGFRVFAFGERTLYDRFIKSTLQDRLPMFLDHDVQYAHLHRPVVVIQEEPDELKYSLYGDPATVYILQRKPFTLATGQTRSRLLKEWVDAVGIMDVPNGINITREMSKNQAYTAIKQAIQAFNP